MGPDRKDICLATVSVVGYLCLMFPKHIAVTLWMIEQGHKLKVSEH